MKEFIIVDPNALPPLFRETIRIQLGSFTPIDNHTCVVALRDESNLLDRQLTDVELDRWLTNVANNCAQVAFAADVKHTDDEPYGVLYRTDYVVEGAGEFPHDMLRYTSSWPRGEEDSMSMSSNHDEKRRVVLSKYHRDPKPVLSEDRWHAKFRWSVVATIETVRL